MAQSGTYALYFSPDFKPSSATFTFEPDVAGNLPTDGTSTSTALAPGQSATYTFAATAGQTYSLTLNPLSGASSPWIYPTLYNPDGTVFKSCPYIMVPYNDTAFCDFTVGSTGTYTLRLTPGGFGAYSMGTYVVQDSSVTLTAGNPGPTVGQSLVPEQHGLLNFVATANQTFALYLSNVSVPSNNAAQVQISGPNNFSVSKQFSQSSGSADTFNLPNLAAGSYVATTTPHYNGAAVSLQASLANGATGTLAPGGAAIPIQTYVPGQNAYLTFNGTRGQNLSLVLAQLALTPTSGTGVSIGVTNPDGSSYTGGTCYTSSLPGCAVSLRNLPQTGTYTVTLEPDRQEKMNLTVAVPTDVSSTITLNNSSTVTLSSVGQQAALTLVAPGGEAVILAVSSVVTSPANTAVSGSPIMLMDPSGLFSLTIQDSWKMLTSFVEKDQIGGTGFDTDSSCTCTCDDAHWKLVECAGRVKINVAIKTGLSPDAEAFARHSEMQHVLDFADSSGRFRRVGTSMEDEMKGRTFTTKEEC